MESNASKPSSGGCLVYVVLFILIFTACTASAMSGSGSRSGGSSSRPNSAGQFQGTDAECEILALEYIRLDDLGQSTISVVGQAQRAGCGWVR